MVRMSCLLALLYNKRMQTTKTILVTGVNGFVGPHLARELTKRGAKVIGVGYDSVLNPSLSAEDVQYISCDLTNQEAVAKIDFSAVDAVIHLAGLASQAMSFEQPAKFISANSAMLINMFEVAMSQKLETQPRFVVVSSGAVYSSDQPMPITEQSILADNSPYIISKLLNEHLCHYYQKRGFQTITVRPFNHTGPGQGPGFLIPDLTAQVLAVGKGGTVKVGNLATRRDYSDARDIVRAYADLALADQLDQDVFNLCSGVSRSGQEVLELIAQAAYGDKNAVKTEVDPQKIRPTDPPEIYGDNSAIKNAVGWQPTIDLETTINDYVAWLQTQPKK